MNISKIFPKMSAGLKDASGHPNLLDRFSPGYQFAAKAFAKAGLDLDALAQSEDHDAVVGLLSTPASAEAAVAREADLTALKTELAQVKSQLGLSKGQAHQFTAGLSAVGVRFEEGAAITAASVEQAVRARSSIMACDQLAQHGLSSPLPLAPSGDPTAPRSGGSGLTGLAKVRASFARESAARAAAE